MEQTPLQEQVQTSSLPSTEQSPVKLSTATRNIISISATVLGASFFMPWATFFGGNLSGLELQKHVESYKLVWMLPTCAAITLFMNMVGKTKASGCRITGAIPFAILACSLIKFGSDLFQIMSWGAWVSLASGFILIVAPSSVKSPSKT